MTTKRRDSERFAAILIICFLLITSAIIWRSKNESDRKFKKELLIQDSILATKLLLDKEIYDLNSLITNYRGKNEELDLTLSQTEKILSKKTAQINMLYSGNVTLNKLQKQFKDLQKLNKTVEHHVKDLLKENKILMDENSRLKSELANTIPPLEQYKPAVTVSSFKIELLRTETKLTTKTRKIRRINIQFDLKNNSGVARNETLYIVVKNNKGNVLSTIGNPVAINGEIIAYSYMQNIELNNKNKKLNITIKLLPRLKEKGLISIEVYSQTDGIIAVNEVRTN